MNRERVQMLRDMIAGIPQKQMNLNDFYRKDGEPCGTIACIAGWASIYPPFVEQGFHKHPRYSMPSYGQAIGATSAAQFFDVDAETFYPRLTRERGSHKSIALRRLDALLKSPQ